MRLVCDACGEIGPLVAASAGDATVVCCTHCGHRAALTITEPSEPSGPSKNEGSGEASVDAPRRASDEREAGPADRCPKCRVRYGEREACPGCGLAVTRMAGFAEAQREDVPDSVHTGWRSVLEHWQEQPLHDAFVQQVATAGAFAWAAGQYQDVCRRRPQDAIASRQLDRVRRTAEAAMLASAAAAREVGKRPYRGATAILVMMVIVLIAGALYATFMRESRGPSQRATPAVVRGRR